jgi:hypothetical protein
VPTDEDTGVAVLTELLARYPVMVSDVLLDDEPPIAEIEPTELAPPQIVDLDEWFVAVSGVETPSEPESEPLADNQQPTEGIDLFVLAPPPDWFPPRPRIGEPRETQLALDFE